MANKKTRIRVWNKYLKRCAYCANKIEYEDMQVDHIIPLRRNDSDEELGRYGIVRGEDIESNMNPSCRRCNKWKGTFTIEQFRKEIILQLDRLMIRNAGYRMAMDYGLIKINRTSFSFWFEIYEKEELNENINNEVPIWWSGTSEELVELECLQFIQEYFYNKPDVEYNINELRKKIKYD